MDKDHTSQYFIAAAIASAVPSILFCIQWLTFDPNGNWILLVTVSYTVTLFPTVLLGIPSVLLLKRLKLFNVYSMIITGFVMGVIFYAALEFRNYGVNYSSMENHEWLVIKGVTTSAGWSRHLSSATSSGFLAASVSFVSFLYLNYFVPRQNKTVIQEIEQ